MRTLDNSPLFIFAVFAVLSALMAAIICKAVTRLLNEDSKASRFAWGILAIAGLFLVLAFVSFFFGLGNLLTVLMLTALIALTVMLPLINRNAATEPSVRLSWASSYICSFVELFVFAAAMFFAVQTIQYLANQDYTSEQEEFWE